MNDSPRPSYAIIGATGGIGRALVSRLAPGGARLFLAAREEDKLKALGDEIDAAGTTALDAQDFEAVESFVESAAEESGGLAGLVNLAGSILLKPAHRTSPDELSETVAQNLTTAFATVRAASLHMRRSGGSVVLMSSAAALMGMPNHEAIAAAKGAIIGLVRSAASTYSSSKLRFNAVAPGLVDTPMAERITSNETSLEASRAMHPLGRIGAPEDVAAAIQLLVSDDSSWVTGQVWSVDGGLATARGRKG